MNKLPSVYVNKIDKDIKNSQEESILNDKRVSLDEVFDPSIYQFNHKYLITLKNGVKYNTSLIGNYGSKVLTIDNQFINISDIMSIQEIKK